MTLRAHYLAYLAALNERRFADLSAYVADELVYNDSPMTLGEYRALLEDDVRRIPDLTYDPRLIVVDNDVVACRLRFDCTPQEPFRGLPPGVRAVFAEHVFYRFSERRIVRVWSLLEPGGAEPGGDGS